MPRTLTFCSVALNPIVEYIKYFSVSASLNNITIKTHYTNNIQ